MDVNLDRRIDIQSATEVQDAVGELIETWANLDAGVPAEVMPLSGGEQFAASQHLASAVTRFRVRHRTDLTRKMRVVYDSQNWDIKHLEEDHRFDRLQYLVITAELKPAT